MKKRRKIIIVTIILLIFLFFIIPYVKVECATLLHGDEFSDLYTETHMKDDISYLKVMGYDKKSASIYYVEKEHKGAILCEFTKQGGEWRLNVWKTIWSKSGSADGFIWPYYR